MGVMKIEPTAAIIPPIRQLIRLGATLEKSNAGDTKLATMLMPMVAVMNVNAPSATANVLSMRLTVSTGSMMSWPNTGRVEDVVITVSSEKPRKLTGNPQKLPRLTSAKLRP